MRWWREGSWRSQESAEWQVGYLIKKTLQYLFLWKGTAVGDSSPPPHTRWLTSSLYTYISLFAKRQAIGKVCSQVAGYGLHIPKLLPRVSVTETSLDIKTTGVCQCCHCLGERGVYNCCPLWEEGYSWSERQEGAKMGTESHSVAVAMATVTLWLPVVVFWPSEGEREIYTRMWEELCDWISRYPEQYWLVQSAACCMTSL